MTENAPASTRDDTLGTIDLAALREREDVPVTTRTTTHEDADHCEAAAAGRVVVGVTDEAGRVLLLVHDDGPHALLPNQPVDADEDWRAVARETAGKVAGAAVTLTAVECLRRVEHVTAADDTPHNVTHHLVFGATVSETTDPTTGDEGWSAGWYDKLPVAAESEGGAVADIEQFLE